jgi:hypothetical protein
MALEGGGGVALFLNLSVAFLRFNSVHNGWCLEGGGVFWNLNVALLRFNSVRNGQNDLIVKMLRA